MCAVADTVGGPKEEQYMGSGILSPSRFCAAERLDAKALTGSLGITRKNTLFFENAFGF